MSALTLEYKVKGEKINNRPYLYLAIYNENKHQRVPLSSLYIKCYKNKEYRVKMKEILIEEMMICEDGVMRTGEDVVQLLEDYYDKEMEMESVRLQREKELWTPKPAKVTFIKALPSKFTLDEKIANVLFRKNLITANQREYMLTQ